MSNQPTGGIPNPQTHPVLGPAERLSLITEGAGGLEIPLLPFVAPGPLPTWGFDLAGVFSTFWQNYVLARYNTTILLLPLITPEMPGVATVGSYDSYRAQATNYSDGTFGVGLTATDPTTQVLRKGYFSPQPVSVGINDTETTYERNAAGMIVYTKPVIYWQPPVAIKKGDLIIRPDGRRYIVGDVVTPGQVWGTTIINYAELESRSIQDITYQVPL